MRVPRVAVPRVAAAALALLALVGCATDPPATVSPTTVPPTSPAPASPTPPPTAAQARTIAEGMSDVELVGQVLMPDIGYGETPAAAADLLRRYHLGGVILMGNIENTKAEASAAQVRALTAALRAAAQPDGAQLVPLIGTDQEYGWVTRIKAGIVQLPGGMAFGAAGRPDLTETAWRAAGAELAAIGINVDFAPDADVVGSAGNTTIGSRSFGGDATAVAAQVAAAVTGMRTAGIASGVKHFPGHGHTTVNSHTALPVLTQSLANLRSGDLPPFQAGIDAGTDLVMSGHLQVNAVDPAKPASFSSKVLIDLLRTQLKFTGVVVTDAMNMEPAKRGTPGAAAVEAFLAGNDLLLMPPDLAKAQQGLLAALKAGTIPRARMLDSVTRLVALKLRLRATPTGGPLLTAEHRAAAQAVTAAAVTVLKGACTGPLVQGSVRVTASAGRGKQVASLTAALKAKGIAVVTSGGTRVHLVGYLDSAADLASDAAVTVAMDSPYLLGSSTSPTRIATYSSGDDAMTALAAVLAGAAKPVGRSPVMVKGLPRSACAG